MRQLIAINTLQGASVFLLFCLFLVTGIKTFVAWPQVMLLWDSGRPLSDLVDHYHFSRYLAAYPGLMLDAYWPGVGFSIYISVVTAVNTVLFRRLQKAFTGMNPGLISYLIFIMMHIAMNGRGAMGWCGWMICLSLYASYVSMDRGEHFITIWRSLLMLVSVLLSSVSSGVFLVVFISILILICRLFTGSIQSFGLKLKHIPSLTFAIAVIGYVIYRAIYFAIDAIEKIHLFFGSYTAVIYHGLGILTERFGLETLIMLGMFTGAMLLLFWLAFKNRIEPLAWQFFATALLGGAFGFLTMTLLIPIILIFFNLPAKILLKSLLAPKRTRQIRQ